MNTLLEQTRQQIESTVPKQFKEPYTSIVTAGKKLMWDDKTFQFVEDYVQTIQGPDDVVNKVAHGVTKGIAIISQEFKVPPKLEDPFYAASFPASLVLTCDVLEYVESAKKIPIDENLLAATSKSVTAGLVKLYGITPELMEKARAKSEEMSQQGKPGLMDTAAPPAQVPPATLQEEA